MSRPALFVDRDGTLIVEREYLGDGDGVALIPGAAAALRSFAQAGYALIVVTNQSGIARGLFTTADFQRVQDRLADLLAAEGVALDGVYFCPHHPDFGDPCACRKPGTGLYVQAAAAHDLDVRMSVYVGDRIRDVAPAATLGGRGILVLTGHGSTEPDDHGFEVAADLAAVAARVLQVDTPGGPE